MSATAVEAALANAIAWDERLEAFNATARIVQRRQPLVMAERDALALVAGIINRERAFAAWLALEQAVSSLDMIREDGVTMRERLAPLVEAAKTRGL